jgi:hypothetical protein
MDLIFTVLKTIMATAGDDTNPPLLEYNQATMVLTEAFNNYLYGDGSLSAWGMPRLDTVREETLGFLLRRAEQFVIAHELGHVVAGHVVLSPSKGNVEQTKLKPENEFAADRFAVELLLVSDPLWLRGRPEDHAQYLAGAILSFFTIAAAVDRLRRELTIVDRTTGTHPELLERTARVRTLLAEALPGHDPFGRVDAFDHWLAGHLPGIVGWFREIQQVFRRPGRWETT